MATDVKQRTMRNPRGMIDATEAICLDSGRAGKIERLATAFGVTSA